ncbi:hypothetical protein E1301_Tti012195 [Triplophysa tibetana]|uniref:Uncharacterized protein n=1 Tax=Triplophysa tibetana TaxID=1572043 RepID=A0A5A9P861_9TELE|nr:hypothetical protein E1301_Tti012195 [Triplophysa tibetana]
MGRRIFDFVCVSLQNKLTRRHTHLRQAITVDKRIAVALWYLATGSRYNMPAKICSASAKPSSRRASSRQGALASAQRNRETIVISLKVQQYNPPRDTGLSHLHHGKEKPLRDNLTRTAYRNHVSSSALTEDTEVDTVWEVLTLEGSAHNGDEASTRRLLLPKRYVKTLVKRCRGEESREIWDANGNKGEIELECKRTRHWRL